MGTSRLGSLLVEEGLLSEADRRTIKGTCGSHGPAFARSIIALGLLDEDELAAFLAEKTPWRVASKDLFRDSDQKAWGSVDRPLLERLEVLPLKLVNQTLFVAMVDPLDQDTIKQLAFFTGYKIHPVISTLTHIRSSLKKILKDYEPASSHLEELIANHAVAAGRRVRLADLKPGATKAPAPKVEAPAEETDDFEIEDLPAAASIAAAPAPKAEAASPGLEYPDSVNAAEEGDFSLDDDLTVSDPAATGTSPADATPAAANAMSTADVEQMMADDPVGLDGLDDDFGDEAAADLKAEGDLLADLGDDNAQSAPEKKPSAMAAAAAASDELEDLADLSEFDPEKDEGGSDDLDADLGDLMDGDSPAGEAAAEAAAVAAEGELEGLEDTIIGAPTSDPAADELELGEDLTSLAVAENEPMDLAAELSAESSGGPALDFGAAEADAGGDLSIGDLASEGNPTGELLVNEEPSEPAVGDDTDDLLAGSATEELTLGEDAGDLLAGTATEGLTQGDDAAADPLGDIETELSGDSLSGDSLSGDPLAGIGASASPEVDPLAGIGDLVADPADLDDPLAEAPPSGTEQLAATLNAALLSLTMAKDLESAVKRAAPALSEAGLARALVLDASKSLAKPLFAWSPAAGGPAVKKDGLAALVTPGLAAALARQFAGWTTFDDATRDQNLKPFASWTDADHQLRVAAVPLKGDRQLVVIASWKSSTRDDASIKTAALEMVRRLAAKA